jgi:hypothetical protein
VQCGELTVRDGANPKSSRRNLSSVRRHIGDVCIIHRHPPHAMLGVAARTGRVVGRGTCATEVTPLGPALAEPTDASRTCTAAAYSLPSASPPGPAARMSARSPPTTPFRAGARLASYVYSISVSAVGEVTDMYSAPQ